MQLLYTFLDKICYI